ncbi:MAG TPA: hypothetical protein VFL12_08510 [Thermoanaerobaculia bacterium]|nr:hypothetical protein [Thermoanaerobaculia bacterium]
MERCERCGQEHGLRFVCLGRRLCFGCARTVVGLTKRFPALHEIAATELAEVVSDHGDGPASGRCARCGADAAGLLAAGRPVCPACARELAHAV